MDQQAPEEFALEALSDIDSARGIVKAILHTIFFYRYFPTIEPHTQKFLDLRLPYVVDAELETMIDQHSAKLVRDLEIASTTSQTNLRSGAASPALPHQSASAKVAGASGDKLGNKRGIVKIQFFERRRRTGWIPRPDEEVCWESWVLKLSIAEPRNDIDRLKLQKAMSRSLLSSVVKITNYVTTNKSHIPPITTAVNTNPFPYRITVNPVESTWSNRLRMY
ncbi:hypothetical protein TD95_001859 [Thielaviopsis punctulata]|uniref:Autophagy-related protein 101 n=1 Tax=Thielaviopsis punctulata TaxID=72032 RepID=A0A0F4ZEE4_9PEZI|nr:hypothetical protein TD95_001859 [Thielaviopsis punctulata]